LEILYIDAHCHADDFELNVLENFISRHKMVIIGVGMDYASSLKIIHYAEQLRNFIPCIGIHPWKVGEVSEQELERVLSLADKVDCLGEVGLDTKFVPETIDRQRKFFERFLKAASEYDMLLNVHSAGTWEEVFNLLRKFEIRRAIFHWYTGPLGLLKHIENEGYFITINPSVRFQKKHRRVVEEAPLSILLTESDGPYQYRGIFLNPDLIPDTVREIAQIKNINEKTIREAIIHNSMKLFTSL